MSILNQLKEDLKVIFCFLNPSLANYAVFLIKFHFWNIKKFPKQFTKVLIDRRMAIMLMTILVTNGDEDGDDGEPGAWPDLAR